MIKSIHCTQNDTSCTPEVEVGKEALDAEIYLDGDY